MLGPFSERRQAFQHLLLAVADHPVSFDAARCIVPVPDIHPSVVLEVTELDLAELLAKQAAIIGLVLGCFQHVQ